MKLIVVNSNSSGNSYMLEANNGQQLCLEAGCPIKEVRKVAKLKYSKCVGVLVTHSHQDHSKYVKDFLKAGISVHSTEELSSNIHKVNSLHSGETISIGDFRVTPLSVEHDVQCLSYLIYHEEMGALWFFTDCYNIPNVIRGVKYYMCECNYDDAILDKATQEVKVTIKQADRIRLSHMSLAHAVELLQRCDAENSARSIVLVHGSSRHLNPDAAVSKFQQVLGVPTFYARKGLTLNLD